MKDLGNKPVMAANIKRFMREKNVNAKELSRAIEVPYTTVLSWIKAEYYPRIDKIELMSDYFGCLKSDLIEGENKKEARQIMIDELKCLTAAQRELIAFAESIPEDKAERVLSMMKLMLED